MPFTSGKFTRSAVGAGAAAVALLGAGGAAFAQGGAPAAPSPDQAQHQTAHPDKHDKHGKAGKHGKHRKHHPLAGVQHGEFTKTTKQGERTFDIQRGTVVSADPAAVTVRSKDGFTATYAVDQSTKVHKQHRKAPITEVRPGDRVGVRAVKDGARAVAHQVHDSGAPQPKQQPGQ